MSDFPLFGEHSPPPPPPPAPPTPGWWRASDGNWYPPETAPGASPPPVSAYGTTPAYGPPPGYGPPSGYGPPPGPPPAYGGAGYGYTPYAGTTGTNGFAIASLVLGILWIDFLGSILALIFGYIALSQIKLRNQGGRGMAIAGVVLGWIGLAVLVIIVIAAIASPD